MHIYMS